MSEVEALKQALADKDAELTALRDQLAEQSALESIFAKRMAQVLKVMPAGVIVIGNQGRVALANPAAEALLGKPLIGELWMQVINRSFAPKNDDGHEISLRDGRRVSLLTSAMQDEAGQLVLLTDQTETRLLQGRLSQYQRLSEMGRMMASLAHQIRTPLAAATLYASHLERDVITDAQRKKFAAKVSSRLAHLEQQVRDMLVFARGEMRLEDRISVAQLLRSIDEMLDVPLAEFDADCEFDDRTERVGLQCNLEMLLGALLNLINNALQACGKGAELVIVAEVCQEMVCLRVVDHGPGMTPEQCQKATEPFVTTKSHGTGLGLAVANVVAQAHNGRFELSSVAGEGTTATVCLPLISDLEKENE